jgi:hypothetical protein
MRFWLSAALAAGLAGAPFETVKTLEPDRRTRIAVTDYGQEAGKPVRLQVSVDDKPLYTAPLTGRSNWLPTALEDLKAQDLDGDSVDEGLIFSSANHGGSGSVEYLHVVKRAGSTVKVFRLETVMENIHSGAFVPARYQGRWAGVVVTRPLMDNETRAEPTRWSVTVYRLGGAGFVKVHSAETARRYSEHLPAEAVRPLLPRGWSV